MNLANIGIALKSAAPSILVGLGVLGAAAATVYACVQTTKAPKIVEEHKKEVEDLKNEAEPKEEGKEPAIDNKEYKKRLAKIYFRTGWKFVKLYIGPALVLGASICSMLYSHKMMRKGLVGLAAAYEALDKSYKHYRKNVVDRYGEDVDRELRFDIREEKLKDIDPESVTEENKKDKVKVASPLDGYSDYARFYEDGCIGWEKSSEWNLAYLKNVQSKCNDILKTRGYLFLNEVYQMLGIPMTEAGQVVGWLRDGDGDGVVDFGMYDIYKEKNRDFVNGYENVILLDFNVDGYILDKIWVNNSYPRHRED